MSAPRKPLSFYGRQNELHQLGRVLTHGSWFFMQTSGRGRIGKTTLIQHVPQRAGTTRTLYIPDSDPALVYLVARLLAAQASLIDATSWFCDMRAYRYAMDGAPLFRDGQHLSVTEGRFAAQQFERAAQVSGPGHTVMSLI